MKTLLKLLLLLAVAVYLVFAFTRLVGGKDSTKCTAVNVVINDSIHAGFIDEAEVMSLLDRAGLNPTGKAMDDINGEAIEQTLLKNSFIRLAKCYKSPDGRVNIHVAQRLPLMRVKAENGDDYYLDGHGKPMNPQNYTADLVVATGHISRQYASKKLLPLAHYLHDHQFANDLVTQVNVDANGDVDLVPRIGCQIIHLGQLDSAAVGQQMANLQAFYSKVLPTVGLNTYREVSLEFTDQIVCKKR